jgi:hypothetical protein
MSSMSDLDLTLRQAGVRNPARYWRHLQSLSQHCQCRPVQDYWSCRCRPGCGHQRKCIHNVCRHCYCPRCES